MLIKDTVLNEIYLALWSKNMTYHDKADKAHPYLNAFWQLVDKLEGVVNYNKKTIYDAVSPYLQQFSHFEMLNSLSNLDYVAKPLTQKNITSINLPTPALIVSKDKQQNDMFYVVYHEDENLILYNPYTDEHLPDIPIEQLIGQQIFYFKKDDQEKSNEKTKDQSWLEMTLLRFTAVFSKVVIISIVINLLTLAIPLYIMYVFNSIITLKHTNTLGLITIGVLICLFADLILRILKSDAIGWIGSRVDHLVVNQTLNKLINLPIQLLESVSVSSQLARIKSFVSLRDFFTGAIFSSVLEFPSLILIILILGFIHPYFLLAPLGCFIVFAVIMLLAMHYNKHFIETASAKNTEKYNLTLEYLENINDLRINGIDRHYRERLHLTSENANHANFVSFFVGSAIDAFGGFISNVGILLTTIIGIFLIWDQQLSIGGLIATVFIMWKVFNPLQIFASTLIRFEKIKKTISQVDSFIKSSNESSDSQRNSTIKSISGKIEFKHVGVHFKDQANLILRNFSVTINPRELVIISGPSGAGKSLILQLILGGIKPGIGKVLIDSYEISQFNLRDVRRFISYLPQTFIPINGSIIDNITLFNPFISNAEKEIILDHLEIRTETNALTDKENTILSPETIKTYPKGLLEKINLSRMYTTKSPIKLIDGLSNHILQLKHGDQIIDDIISWTKSSTVIIVSNNKKLKDVADKVIHIDENHNFKVKTHEKKTIKKTRED